MYQFLDFYDNEYKMDENTFLALQKENLDKFNDYVNACLKWNLNIKKSDRITRLVCNEPLKHDTNKSYLALLNANGYNLTFYSNEDRNLMASSVSSPIYVFCIECDMFKSGVKKVVKEIKENSKYIYLNEVYIENLKEINEMKKVFVNDYAQYELDFERGQMQSFRIKYLNDYF